MFVHLGKVFFEFMCRIMTFKTDLFHCKMFNSRNTCGRIFTFQKVVNEMIKISLIYYILVGSVIRIRIVLEYAFSISHWLLCQYFLFFLTPSVISYLSLYFFTKASPRKYFSEFIEIKNCLQTRENMSVVIQLFVCILYVCRFQHLIGHIST